VQGTASRSHSNSTAERRRNVARAESLAVGAEEEFAVVLEMTDHRGSFDALQLKLDTRSLDATTIVQIKVIAPTLHFHQLSKAR
jgi:hypothetical protein